MKIELNAPVWTSDDVEVGRVDGVIVAPGSGEVRAVVIRRRRSLTHDIEVPAGAVQAGGQGSLRLTYTVDHLRELPHFVAGDAVPPPAGAVTATGQPASDVLWPAGYVPDTLPPGQPYRVDRAVRNAAAAMLSEENRAGVLLREGSEVRSRDGRCVGYVERLSFDEATGRLSGVIVGRGAPPSSSVALPASVIAASHAGIVCLSVEAAELIGRES